MWRLAPLILCAVISCVPGAKVGGTAAYRYSSGGAYGRVGVGKGGTGSLYFSDRGGPLTRLFVLAASVVGAAGAIQNVETKTDVFDNGNEVIVHKETTADIDVKQAEGSNQLAHSATDADTSFAERHGRGYSGFTGSFEIASRYLGGDTSGWMGGFGYEGRSSGTIGFEAGVKLGFGRFTMHDRTLTGYDDTSAAPVTTMGDSTYPFLGFNVRFGVIVQPSREAQGTSVEAFVAPDLNMLALETDDKDPTANAAASVWHLGVRFTTLAVAYLEGTVSFSSMLEAQRSYGMEVGLAF